MTLPLKDMIQTSAPLHTRKISVATYPAEDGKVVVEGWLNDDRLVEIYRHWDNQPRETGPVHSMCVRLLVGGYPIEILDAEAEMRTVPSENCPEILDSVKKVIGTAITAGYTERVREILKGVKGCTHLTHLIVVMGPAALHGFWTMFAQYPRPVPKSLDEVEGLEYLINSCHLWAPDGEHVRTLKEAIEKLNGAGEDAG